LSTYANSQRLSDVVDDWVGELRIPVIVTGISGIVTADSVLS
jgi:hypothetical protein